MRSQRTRMRMWTILELPRPSKCVFSCYEGCGLHRLGSYSRYQWVIWYKFEGEWQETTREREKTNADGGGRERNTAALFLPMVDPDFGQSVGVFERPTDDNCDSEDGGKNSLKKTYRARPHGDDNDERRCRRDCGLGARHCWVTHWSCMNRRGTLSNPQSSAWVGWGGSEVRGVCPWSWWRRCECAWWDWDWGNRKIEKATRPLHLLYFKQKNRLTGSIRMWVDVSSLVPICQRVYIEVCVFFGAW